MKLTPWFDGNAKPKNIGVYQRQRIAYQHMANKAPKSAVSYSRWDGTHWSVSYSDIGSASSAICISAYQDISWRGLREQA